MQHRPRKLSHAGLLVGLTLQLLAACAVIVDPEALLVRCELEDGDQARDPCVELGQQCVDNVCRDCDADAVELCNGRDDDCDGKIDEGHDADHDGFTWCGGGRVELADCVDRDGAIHPAARNADGSMDKPPEEICDGKDNDCDSKVDEDKNCDEKKTCVEDGCPMGQRCDTESGVCIVPRDVGSGCTNDADCKGGFCLRPGTLDLPVSLMDNRCATACCSNADCDESSSCLISSGGARVCLPKNIVGAGTRKVSDRCVRDSECTSRLCFRGVCQTPCYNGDACPSQGCVLSPSSASELRMFTCADPPGVTPGGAMCPLLAVCRSGYCNDELRCREACARDSDCGKGNYCGFEAVRQVIGPTSMVSVCMEAAAGGGDAEGIEHLCCTDADCGQNQLCAPNQATPRSQWHMSCRGK